MTGKRVVWGIILAVLLSIGVCGWASAQDFPTHRIELYVGYAAGGATDILARAVANLGS